MLAEELRTADSVEHALERYVGRRKVRVNWVQEASRRVAESFRLAPAVRNAALSDRGERLMQERFAPLLIEP